MPEDQSKSLSVGAPRQSNNNLTDPSHLITLKTKTTDIHKQVEPIDDRLIKVREESEQDPHDNNLIVEEFKDVYGLGDKQSDSMRGDTL